MSSSYIVYSGEVSSGLDLTWGDSIVLSGGTAVETTLADYASMSVTMNGQASDTVVNSGGSINASYGVLSSTTVNSGGSVEAAYSATISDLVINSGGRLTTRANKVNGLEINSGGTAWVYRGTVNAPVVHESASLTLYNDGTEANSVMLAGSGYDRAQMIVSKPPAAPWRPPPSVRHAFHRRGRNPSIAGRSANRVRSGLSAPTGTDARQASFSVTMLWTN